MTELFIVSKYDEKEDHIYNPYAIFYNFDLMDKFMKDIIEKHREYNKDNKPHWSHSEYFSLQDKYFVGKYMLNDDGKLKLINDKLDYTDKEWVNEQKKQGIYKSYNYLYKEIK